jgi:hypothetical protein
MERVVASRGAAQMNESSYVAGLSPVNFADDAGLSASSPAELASPQHASRH